MASLKSFLYGVAPILGTTGATLYERQRALVNLGVLKSAPGRGPGSGVPLTSESFAAVLISLLATDNLSEVDQRVVAICNAKPEGATRRPSDEHVRWVRIGKPTFQSEVAKVLSGQEAQWRSAATGFGPPYRAIRVSRCWRGQILTGRGALRPTDYTIDGTSRYRLVNPAINITAEIEDDVLERLAVFTQGALSQISEEGDDE